MVLTSDSFEGQQGDRWLRGLRLASVAASDGRAVDLRSSFSHAGPNDREGGMYQVWLAFDVADPETGAVQSDCYHAELNGVIVVVEGPWRLTWDL